VPSSYSDLRGYLLNDGPVWYFSIMNATSSQLKQVDKQGPGIVAIRPHFLR
jgi:hypothetical protein